MPAINDSLTSLAAGLTADRSKAKAVTYGTVTVTPTEYVNAYRTSPWAKAAIDTPAEDMFRKWREWQADKDDITKIEDAERKLGVRQKLEKAMKLARLHGRGFLFMDNGEPADTPLLDTSNRPLRYVVVLRKSDIAPGEIDTDPLSPTYDEPMWYEVAGNTAMVRIHPSRLVVFNGNERTDACDPDSILTAALTSIKNLDSVYANVADMVFEAKVDVIGIPGLMELAGDPETEKQVLKAIQVAMFSKGVNGALLLDSGDGTKDGLSGMEYEQKQLSFAGLTDIINAYQVAVSGATRIPRALLFGVSAGGLGSTGNLEMETYYNYIGAEQDNVVRPAIWRLDDLIIKTALGSRPPEIYYTWAPLWSMSETDRADIGLKQAQKWQIIAGLLDAEAFTRSMVNDFTESGTAPGLDTEFQEWLDGGGDLAEQDDEDAMTTTTQQEPTE